MNYIGIRGHRGAGKIAISYLIGNTLNYLEELSLSNNSDNDFDSNDFDFHYQAWCDDVLNSEQIIYDCDLKHIYFESFSDSLKLFIILLIGCPRNYLYDDYYKDHMVINIRDFSYNVYDNIEEYNDKLLSREDVINILSKNKQPVTITQNMFMTLREFILYFGIDTMQRSLGLNVWVKSLQANEALFKNIFDNNKDYRIYFDVKTPSEVTYIKNKSGVIIKIDRPGNKKQSKGFDKLKHDDRIDYTINVKGNLYDLKDCILNISKEIKSKKTINQNG